MDLISYPFRLNNDGTVATTEDGDDYYAEELAMLIKTTPGERALVPDYGITDPTFATFEAAELASQINIFGPPVRIEDIRSVAVRDGIYRLDIDYEGIPLDDPDYPTFGAPEYTVDTDYDEDNQGEDYDFTDATDF